MVKLVVKLVVVLKLVVKLVVVLREVLNVVVPLVTLRRRTEYLYTQ